jgi:hypothetical protein
LGQYLWMGRWPLSIVAMAQMHRHHHWTPRKATYGKRMRAHWGARCKMSGSC